MEMKSTAPYPSIPVPPPPPPPPPPYNFTVPYPGPQPSSYRYPHPETSKTPNHPVGPPTTEIGFRQVYTVEPNQEPAPVVVIHRYRNRRCYLSSLIGLFFLIIMIIVMVKFVIRVW